MSNPNHYPAPSRRPLKVYAFDPSWGRLHGNHMTVEVPYEKLRPGPAGRYLEVIDYDASNDRYYVPVDLDHPAVLMQGGLEPSESDPRFHQQMVYAVAGRTIGIFEFALGRPIKWGFNRFRRVDQRRPLRIYPHGMQEANAFYSRDLGALVFGYFRASDADPAANLPGQTIFTCLSHDIIAHETTHALVDGQRMHFMEATSRDTLAFHEAFADIVALFQHFSSDELLGAVIARTGGLIYRPQIAPAVEDGAQAIGFELTTANPLVQLAKQFGEAMGRRAALRSALGTRPDPGLLDRTPEAHERGAILVAAVFDAFFTIYMNRIVDLLRIAGHGRRIAADREIHPDLAARLAAEAGKTARHFLNICIRALDYCPPVDIQFGDFLRAVITADFDLVREDPLGYRTALIDAFRRRGIRPTDVFSYSEESLRWCPPEDLSGRALVCEGLEFDFAKRASARRNAVNARVLHAFADRHRAALGLETDPAEKLRVHSFHPLHRIGPDGQLKLEAVAEIIQKKEVPVDPRDPALGRMTFYGGVTLLVDLSFGRAGEVRYSIRKSLDLKNPQNARLAAQRDFFRDSAARYSRNVYAPEIDFNLPSRPADGGRGLSFDMVHRGY